ncbi:ADP-ribosylation factor 4-like [Ruditapes philippinarum]|uniref:ADP-ribosylation factor 4-like n=1 Tax=Ruditapes philippinarum TaxID=129788 RepID=UPI00295AF38E|nr:ADP-ribosylation factor 4-like [Ruditapes philippinarum]
MGNSVFKRLFADKNVRILIIGHEYSYTVLRSLKLGKLSFTMAGEGIFAEVLRYKNVEMTALDLGGRMSIRPLLPHYYATIQGLVFVLDCCSYRVDDTINEYCEKIQEDVLPNDVPVLILANNHDDSRATSLDNIREQFGKEKCFIDRHWKVHGVNFSDKEDNGLFEAFDWLSDQMITNEKQKMALDIFVGANNNGTTDTSDQQLGNKENKGFLSKFAESLKKTLVCRPVIRQ